jgi:drug/metabolite transporter (DMT)-like permease
MYGLQMIDSASASLILNLEGVFTALLAWFAFKENFDRRIAAGMALIVAGGVLLSMGSALRAGGFVGPLAIAGACLAWALDNNLTRKVAINDAMLVACIKGVIAGPLSVWLAMRYGAHMPAGTLVLRAGLLGFVGYGLSLTLFVVALRHLGTARTGAYFSLAHLYRRYACRGLGRTIERNLDDRRTIHGGGCVATSHRKSCPSAPSFTRRARTFARP